VLASILGAGAKGAGGWNFVLPFFYRKESICYGSIVLFFLCLNLWTRCSRVSSKNWVL